jgi:hypothetical protein
MSDRDEALAEIARLAARHGLTGEEIAASLRGTGPASSRASNSVLARAFGYIGGALVCTGLAIYVGMRWNELGSVGRVLVTLGPGLCTFVFALVCTTSASFERATTPLFLTAGLLQPTGILVAMSELSSGGDPRYALLAMNAVMVAQQGCAFVARRRTVLAFTSVVFALGFFLAAFDLADADGRPVGLVLGLSLCCVGWATDRSRQASLAGLLYFVGTVFFLGSAYDVLRRSTAEPLFAALACGVVLFSTIARSRTMLFAGTVALIGYTGSYIADHFANQVAAPVLLMLMGFLLIGAGAAAVWINNRYMRRDDGSPRKTGDDGSRSSGATAGA